MHALAQHRANFAQAHGGYYFVHLGRAGSILPGVTITPESVSDDGRTVVYTARLADARDPSHLRLFDVTVKAIPENADWSVISADELGGYATWALAYDAPVFALTV
jgi:hypothetical protein